MIQVKTHEIEELLTKLKIIRQASGEAINLLEHIVQLQEDDSTNASDYDPDDYSERWYKKYTNPEKETNSNSV